MPFPPYTLIDLSVPLQHNAVSEPLKPRINYSDYLPPKSGLSLFSEIATHIGFELF